MIKLLVFNMAGNAGIESITPQTNNLFVNIILGLVIVGSILLLLGYLIRRKE